MSYKEEEKSIARQDVLKEAIEILTKNRFESVLVNPTYIKGARDHLLKDQYFKKYVVDLKDETINKWEEYYKSLISKKKPSQLKVAYLAGLNPENDLEVLAKLGVLPENIWAFESDLKTYRLALDSVLLSKFPHVKIQKSKISQFFATSRVKFDIVYLDFCGPLPNRNKKQKNLETIVSLIANHVLNSPGVLITNVSLPLEGKDSIGRALISKLVSFYLYPKAFLEREQKFTDEDDSYDNLEEGAMSFEYTLDEWFDLINSNLEEYYGQFVTRLLMDLATIIVPYYSFASNRSYMSNFFKEIDLFEEKESELYERIYKSFELYFSSPITTSLEVLCSSWEAEYKEKLDPVLNNKPFYDFTNLFLNQLSPDNNPENTIKKLETLIFFMQEGRVNDSDVCFSGILKDLAKIPWEKIIVSFCDVFLFHQILEFLVRQLAVPYHVNISASKRWSYVAKETRMFLDMIVLDECRYLYDWMPTADNFIYSLEDIERQLIFRFVLDGINRHTRWYFGEYFMGTASIEKMGVKGFEYLMLKRRNYIN